MTDPAQGNQPPSLIELLRWNPWPPGDPGPWVFSQFEEAVRTELVVISLELHKEMLAAQMKATDRVIAAISKRTRTQP
jgi:hypothetical protein